MDFLNMLLVVKPNGMWEKIIFGLEGGLVNYALTLIILTLIIKFVLLPTDFLNRYVTKVNTRKQAQLKPELDKIQRQFGKNKEMLNKKTMELYKRENYSVVGSCFAMLISMVLTMVVFFTLFSGLNKIASYKIYTEYTTLQETYQSVYNYTDEEYVATLSQEQQDELIKQAQQATIKKYDEIRNDFLWIKNIWRADNWQSIVPDYKGFKSLCGKLKGAELPSEEEYNMIMQPVSQANPGWNGYLILTIISMGATLVSMLIPNWMAKLKAKRTKTPYIPMQQNKIMMIVMPIVLGLFTLLYNAAFAIYIVTGSLFGIITQPLITLLVDFIDDKKAKKELEKKKISYSRK